MVLFVMVYKGSVNFTDYKIGTFFIAATLFQKLIQKVNGSEMELVG
jgi:hypothetical protein